MKKFLVDETVMNALAGYLATKPYKEVFQLFTALNQCQVIEIPELTPEPEQPAKPELQSPSQPQPDSSPSE